MADNIDVTPGVGKTVAADEIAGALHQRVKITVGADGTNDGDVSGANPLPVVQTGALPEGANAIGKLAANSGVDIGDVDVTSLPLPTVSSIGNGSKDVTTAGTAVALAGSTACKKIFISAKDTNTGKIFVGGDSVSSTSGGFIYPGGGMTIEISNLASVYIDSEADGEGVQFTYLA